MIKKYKVILENTRKAIQIMVRISDIAKNMQLSEATVSNALTGKGRMKQETRDAVLACASRMGYQSRLRQAASERGKLIIIAESLCFFVPDMISGALRAAGREGVTPPVYSLQMNEKVETWSPDVELLNRMVMELLDSIDYKIAGILFLSQYARKMDGLLSGLSIPVVSVFCTREDGGIFVHYDDHQGAYLAVNALLKSGCRKIAMVSGPIDSIGMYERSCGYQQALIERGIPYDPRLVRIGDWNRRNGYELTVKLLEEGMGIDGIFAQSDEIGIGVLKAVKEKGLRIPEDISVVGFDNSFLCRASEPLLSSVMPPFGQMGSRALSQLLKLVEVKNITVDNSLIPCTLVHRESTKSAV